MLHDFGVQIGTGVSNLAQLLANLGTSLKKVRIGQYFIMDWQQVSCLHVLSKVH